MTNSKAKLEKRVLRLMLLHFSENEIFDILEREYRQDELVDAVAKAYKRLGGLDPNNKVYGKIEAR